MAVINLTENQSLRASATLAAAANVNTSDLYVAGAFGYDVVVTGTPGGTIVANSGITINVLVSADAGSTYPTTATIGPFFLASVASTLNSLGFSLPGGKRYRINLVNTDGTNSIASVSVLYAYIHDVT